LIGKNIGGGDYRRHYIKVFPSKLADQQKKYEEYGLENAKFCCGNIFVGEIYIEPVEPYKIINFDTNE